MKEAFKNRWKKTSYTKRGLFIGFCIPTLLYFIGIIIGSIVSGKFICPAFDSVPGCNLISSIIMSLLFYVFFAVFFVIPSVIFGGTIGFLIGKIKKSDWKKKKIQAIGQVLGLCLVILIIIYIIVGVLLRPANREIVQENLFMKNLCKIQVNCRFETGPYRCHLGIENNELERWTKYNGCNESTSGYYSTSDDYGHTFYYIDNVEYCLCSGL